MIPVVRIIKITKYRGCSLHIIKDMTTGSNLATLASETEAIYEVEQRGYILQPDHAYSFAGGHTNDY